MIYTRPSDGNRASRLIFRQGYTMDNFNNGDDNNKNKVFINVRSRAHNVANERLTLILPLLDNRLLRSEVRALTRKIAEESGLSVKTLNRYLKLYRENQFDGLIPKNEGRPGTRSIATSILVDAAKMKLEFPDRSVRDIINTLELEEKVPVGSIKRSTLQAQLLKIGRGRAQLKNAAQSKWPSDLKHGTNIDGQKTYPSILNSYINAINNTVDNTSPDPCELI
jgi:hypothetical protein